MKKVIHEAENNAGKLRCDAPSCDYECPVSLPWSHALVGLPCPSCGASLLTEKDYQDTERMFRVIAWINKWFSWLFGTERDHPLNVGMSVRWHDGIPETKDIKLENSGNTKT